MQGEPRLPVLDARLEAVAEGVREGATVADIGCDHGQLAAYLVMSGRCPRAYACDVNEKPLSKARALVGELGIARQVHTLLTDGLQGVPLDEADDVVIAGMGGELIMRIIAGEPAARDGRLRFVLQPMTKAPELRRELYRRGFALESERGVCAGNFVYTVMRARYTGEHREIGELFAWTGLLPENLHPDTTDMLRLVHDKLCKRAMGLRQGGDPEAGRWAAWAGQVQEMIRKRRDS